MSGFSFKKVAVEDQAYAPILPGHYNVKFETLEEKATLSGGIAWNAKMKIEGSNRTFFLSWNVENASEVAQRIAREQISQIAELLGVGNDISIESIKTNTVFNVLLEQRVVGDKTYYQTKGAWKLGETSSIEKAVEMAEKAFGIAPAKKKAPWEK
ncbi:MAG: hypothetical protein RIQ94_182 [Pseudomonadota bacterium]|jgi:hypothetical protein